MSISVQQQHNSNNNFDEGLEPPSCNSVSADPLPLLPKTYVPSTALDRNRTLAEVGACVSSGGGGTLYCKKIPIRFRHSDLQADILKTITVKVAVECSTANNRLPSSPCKSILARSTDAVPSLTGVAPKWGRHFGLSGTTLVETLNVELSDDSDPFTLLRLSIKREEFRDLREDQRLLVDFDTFPGTLIELLECCGVNTISECSSSPDDGEIRDNPLNLQERHDSNSDVENRFVVENTELSKCDRRRHSSHKSIITVLTNDDVPLIPVSDLPSVGLRTGHQTIQNELNMKLSENEEVTNQGTKQSKGLGSRFPSGIQPTNSRRDEKSHLIKRPSQSSSLSQSDCLQNNNAVLIALLVCQCSNSVENRPGSIVFKPLVTETGFFNEGTSNRLNNNNSGVEQFSDGKRSRIKTAVLSFIEMNYFKELTHLSLSFTSANDNEMNQFLTMRLSQWKTYGYSLESEIGALDKHRRTWIEICSDLRGRCEMLSTELSRIKNQMKMKYEAEIEQILDERDKQLQTQKNSLCEGRANLETRLNRQIESQCNEIDSLQSKIEELISQKATTEASERTLRRELSELRASLVAKSEDMERVSNSHAQMEEAKKALETENQSLRQRVSSDQSVLCSLRIQLDTLEKSVNELNGQNGLVKETLESSRTRVTELKQALEKSAAEIIRGNELIEKLQTGLRKERIKSKQLEAESQASSTLLLRIADLEKRENVLKGNEDQLMKEVEQLKKELLNSQQTIKGHETTMHSLENQLTDRTIQAVLLSSSSNQSLRTTSLSSSLLKTSLNPQSSFSASFQKLTPMTLRSSPSMSSTTALLQRHLPPTATPIADSESTSILSDSFRKLMVNTSNIGKNTNVNISCPQSVPLPIRLSSNQQQLNSTQQSINKELLSNAPSGDLSFGRQRRRSSPDPQLDNHQSSTTEFQVGRNQDGCSDIESLNYSTSTLESSGAPHFGSRRQRCSLTPTVTTVSEGTDESAACTMISNDGGLLLSLGSVATWDSRENCTGRESSSRNRNNQSKEQISVEDRNDANLTTRSRSNSNSKNRKSCTKASSF